MGLHLSSEWIPGPRAEHERQVQALQQKCKGSQTRCLTWGVRSGEKGAGAGGKGGLLWKLPFLLVSLSFDVHFKNDNIQICEKRERKNEERKLNHIY